MNNKTVFNKDICCSDYVCTSSGCKQSCKRHDIGTQCGATVTNITAKFNSDTNASQNRPKSPKSLKQLVVVSSTADGFPDDLDGYVEPGHYRNHPAAFVPSKVPARRIPIFMNILILEHHITPHMRKVNMMSKLNTLLGKELNEIEKYLDTEI